MLLFKSVKPEDKEVFEKYHIDGRERGCEYTFANLCMWGKQNICEAFGHLVIFSQFEGRYIYPFPLGNKDKKAVLDAIICDAKKKNIPCILSGVYEQEKAVLDELYPGKFRYISNDGTYDYVYDINDLADLGGRKYHSKRNHIMKFKKLYPDYTIENITEDNIEDVKAFVKKWYELRLADSPESDFELEVKAFDVAADNLSALEMEGLLIKVSGNICAVTMGSRMLEDTFDVHFEKALPDVQGAYTIINQEFAKYLRNKYPEVKYLDREEDMGLEGLRKAKLSYKPHHMIVKSWAHLKDDHEVIISPDKRHITGLRNLWKEAFGDGDEFLDAFFTTAFSPQRCRCMTIGDKVAAALYWFECDKDDKKIAYIYAVATKRAVRGRGLCHELMEDAHNILKKLGFDYAVLVPGSKELFRFYEGMGYKVCSYIAEKEIDAKDNHISLEALSTDEYCKERRKYLPENSVIQEGVNLQFLHTQASFFRGDDFVLAARIQGDDVFVIELLGNSECADGVIFALGGKRGIVRTAGGDKPFAMCKPLNSEAQQDFYFGLAFD